MFTLAALFSCATSILFIYSKIPLALTIYLSLNAITVAFIMISYIKSSWFSFILIIVFLSGIIVVFTYISSLSSNEFTPPSTFSIVLIALITTPLLLYSLAGREQPIQTIQSTHLTQTMPTQAFFLHKLYEKDSITIITIIITYLFIALLVVVKNSSLNTAPLRSTNP